MVKLLILGATGRTGSHVVKQALVRGHQVAALVRRTGTLPPEVLVHSGSVLNAGDVARAANGVDAVISALGQRYASDRTLLGDAARAAVEALQVAGAPRFIAVSQGLLFATSNPLVLLIRALLGRTVADSIEMERVVADSRLDYVIVRAPKLNDGPKRCGYHDAVDALPSGAWSMPRADLATCLLDQAERPSVHRGVVGLAGLKKQRQSIRVANSA